ncbi:MAG: YeeE/YedE family protein [Myxococcales bacterium]|nr:MAG: YeeE/YedE family protein [Myxococcales bacterium]
MLTALLGGLLIGASASVAWSGAGQIAGISGLLGRVIRAPASASFAAWFLGALLLTSVALAFVSGPWRVVSVPARPLALIAAAGLLVGYGTQLGNGCTSGHGVCGLSRGSARSLAAVLTFMLSAAAVVFIARHLVAGAVR